MTKQKLAENRLGASESAIAAGRHPYVAPITLWQRHRGELPAFEGNEYTEWGTRNERTIREKWRENHLTPRQVIFLPEESFLKEDWARATPDGIIMREEERGVNYDYGLEIKTAGARSAHRWGETGSDIFPEEYRCQLAWSCWVCDLPRWDLAVLIGGNDYREYTYERNDAYERELVQACRDFWFGHVVPGVPPPVDASREYKDYLDGKHPRAEGEVVTATEEIDLAMAALAGCRSQRDAADRDCRRLENEIREFIGDNLGVQDKGGDVIKWAERQGSVSWKKVAAELMTALRYTDAERKAVEYNHRGEPFRWLQVPRDWGKGMV